MRSRTEGWNDDYLGFLIRKVWKIDSAVSILDCGCGDGYFAPMLMKHMPEGSSYTGADFSLTMTEQAQRLLNNYNINGRIIKCDFLESNFKSMFDVVICQSVLRHIGNPKAFIGKMAEAAAEGGLIVCIDTNRELECSGLYIDGMDYGELCGRSGAIKHWRAELENSARDYAAAMRSAYIMRELNLSDIDIRMSDRVTFVCPEQENYNERLEDFIASKSLWYSDEGEAVERLINHGMTRSEAESYVGKSGKICEYLKKPRRQGSLYTV